VRRNDRVTYSRRGLLRRLAVKIAMAITLLVGIATALVFQAQDGSPDHIPSYVAWTPETITSASSGDAFRGMLLAKRCNHCHGEEGFSPKASTPNLAGMNKLAMWKQLEDFRSRKRLSLAMGPIAQSLSARDVVDVVAYFAALPLFSDPQDDRVFPQSRTAAGQDTVASRLITFGDGERGIPPCQSCHGPVAYRTGVPSLATQNADYLLNQLEAFANGTRANDINEPMRTIASLLTEEERRALAEYYGSGLGLQSASSK